jgi:hypothetical protein
MLSDMVGKRFGAHARIDEIGDEGDHDEGVLRRDVARHRQFLGEV